MEITPINIVEIDNHVKGGKTCYILLYANWCGHCTNFKPTWELLTKEADSSKLFAQIENSIIESIKNKPAFIQNIRGFPTIREITKTTLVDYNGQRDKELIKKWMKRRKGGSRRRKIKKTKRRQKI